VACSAQETLQSHHKHQPFKRYIHLSTIKLTNFWYHRKLCSQCFKMLLGSNTFKHDTLD